MNAWVNNLPGPRLRSVVEEHGTEIMERYSTDDVYFAV